MTDNFLQISSVFRKAGDNIERLVYNEIFVEFTKGMQHSRRVVHKITRRLEHSGKVEGNGKNQITTGFTAPYANIEENVRRHYYFQPGLDIAAKGIPQAMIRGIQKSFS